MPNARVRLRQARIIAFAFLASLGAGYGGSARAAAAHQSGVYVDWGNPWGRESNVEAFEKWAGLSGILALDYMPGGNWKDLVSAAQWLPGYWWQGKANRNVVWSIPLTVSGTTLAQVASGEADGAFQAMAAKIAQAQPNAIIRIGWEANGDWYAWSAAGHEKDYINAFRHVVGIFRAASSNFKFDWCVDFGRGHAAADQFYPGDDVVDIIGMDLYDKNPLSKINASAAWQIYLHSPFGLEWHAQFASQHHKPLSYPEWGVGQEGDNPTFVQGMADWIQKQNVAYSDYWNTNKDYPGLLSSGQYPKSAAVFLQQKP